MNVKLRQELERKIARAFLKRALEEGYSITIENGGDEAELHSSTNLREILKHMFLTDDEHLFLYKDGETGDWVHFVYGNDGWDVISDYTTTLEYLMDTANKISEKYS